MPLLRAVADKISENDMVAGVIDEIIDRDEMFALLPFTRVNGKAYVYVREHADNLTNDNSGFIASGGTVLESSADFTPVTSLLKILIGDVDVDNFARETESDINDQFAIQIALKAKYMASKFKNKLINGDSNATADEFDGLKRYVTVTGNEFAAGANGAALTLDMLDQLIDMVPYGPDVLIMHGRTIRKLRSLLRATGGNDASMIEIPNFGVPVFAFNGIPVVRNDFIGITEVEGTSGAVCSSIYAARFNEMDGFHGIFGGESAGIRVESVGTVQNKDAVRTRLKWYCGTALKSTKAVARLKGINAS
jgi:hypothetical protein